MHVVLRARVAPTAGVAVFAVIVQFGALCGAGGTTSPPAGVQNATGSAGLPLPSGM